MCDIWEQHASTLLTAIPETMGQAVIENIVQRQTALLLVDPPNPPEAEDSLKSMVKGKR